jgi:hypothetical protein
MERLTLADLKLDIQPKRTSTPQKFNIDLQVTKMTARHTRLRSYHKFQINLGKKPQRDRGQTTILTTTNIVYEYKHAQCKLCIDKSDTRQSSPQATAKCP